MKLEARQKWWGLFFVGPNLFLFAAFVLLPVLGAFVLAFKDYQAGKGVFASPWVGLANFRDVVADPVFAGDFWMALANTAVITIVLVPVNIGLALVLAAMIFPLRERIQAFFKAAFYLPGIISAVIIAIVWQWMFTEHNGLINLTLRGMGFAGVPWFSERWSAVWTIILSSIPYAPGAGIILYLAALGRVPPELTEAAQIDGAGFFQRWRHVILPLLKPTTLYMVVISTIESFKIFTPIYVMTRGRPANQSTSIVYEIYQNAFDSSEFGIASAEAIILFAIVLVFALIQFKYLRSDDEY
ncbi:sugar ABC transporter permease [candidate division BRC1 bacterium HGW-BRC1-1]|jgi:multiple sugar transport system permease protein|nr:MAG: sugar ABC transporter permease [candidate division BRC1 bacterium HGW-BRC1-1]